MMDDLVRLLGLVRLTLTDPSEATRRLLSARVPRQALPLMVLLVSVLSTLTSSVMIYLAADVSGQELAVSTGTFFNVILSVLLLFLTAGGIHFVGRMFGGTGVWPQALLLTCWLQVMQVFYGLVVIVILAIVPPLTVIAFFGVAVLSLYVATNAVAELHGFRSRWKVLLGLLVGIFVLFAIMGALQGGIATSAQAAGLEL